jgi:hypothetical protein
LRALAAVAAVVAVTSGCGAAARRAAPKDPPLLSYYKDSFLGFSYPAAWTAHPYERAAELHFRPLVYLSTQPIREPCSTNGDTTTCGFPVAQLRPGGVLVFWQLSGIPATGLGPGKALEVGGRPARRSETNGGECRSIGADRTIDVAVETNPPPSPLVYLTACLRGPGLAQAEKSVDSLLASTTFASR